MSREKVLPLRAPRVTEGQQLEICRLDLRNVPQVEIAKQVGVHRNTVRRVLGRTRAALAVTEDLGPERGRALAVYLEIQRAAWDAYEDARKRGKPAATLLAEVRQTQTRIDALLGLAATGPDDPAMLLAQFKAIVVRLIQTEAPELGPKLARRLLEARDE